MFRYRYNYDTQKIAGMTQQERAKYWIHREKKKLGFKRVTKRRSYWK